LCSPLLSPFGLERVTVCDPAPLCASPSQKPACGFPAQASSCRPSPDGIELDQPSRPWERMPGEIPAEPLPRETTALAPAIQPLAEQAVDHPLNAGEGAAMVGHPKVVEVPTPFTPQRVPEVGECARMALLAEPAIALHPGASQALLRGFPLQPCLLCPALAPVMGKAEKVTGWHRPACPECLPGVAFAPRQQPGLLGMQTQPAFPQPQRQDLQTALRGIRALIQRDGVVRVPQEHAVAPAVLPDSRGKPLVSHRGENGMGDHGRDEGALRAA
jgi:hypothetical protein